MFTRKQTFDFHAAIATDSLEKDIGMRVVIEKCIDGSIRVYPADKALRTSKLDIHAFGMNKAINKFVEAVA